MFTYPLPEIKPAPSKPPTLLFFGRITAYKGLEVLLQAFQQVHQSHAAHLLIVGEGDIRPYQLILQQIPDIEVVNRWVAESEIPAFFQRATLVVLPYTSASQSGVLPVAANFGLPVIASRAGGIPEQILHGQTGLLTDPGSVAGLAQAIKQLLDDPILAQTLGENLRMEFQQHRNWAQITQKVYLACEKAVESLG
jgi:glycosyltransferase involved in cell wall biosynthesis